MKCWIKSARKLCLALSVVLAMPIAGHAEYPERPIIAVVPFDVGGGADIFARLVAPFIANALGGTIVIENKPGAGGNLGMQQVAQARPDGYRILINGMGNIFNPAVFRNMGFDPLKDLLPVAQIAEYSVAITIGTHVPANTLSEFVALLKANPGKYNGASGGIPNLLALRQFAVENDVQFEVIPYRSSGEGTAAILRGDVDFIITDGTSSMAGVAAGKLRNLAVTTETRASSFPDVPTTKEAGMPNYLIPGIYGLYVPAGTPPDIVAKLNAAIAKAVESDELKARFKTLGLTFKHRSSEDFSNMVRGEIERWKEVARRGNIKPID